MYNILFHKIRSLKLTPNIFHARSATGIYRPFIDSNTEFPKSNNFDTRDLRNIFLLPYERRLLSVGHFPFVGQYIKYTFRKTQYTLWKLNHKLQFSDNLVLAKDANTKDDDWFEIYDPRNPLNKRRRGESTTSKK